MSSISSKKKLEQIALILYIKQTSNKMSLYDYYYYQKHHYVAASTDLSWYSEYIYQGYDSCNFSA